MQRALRTRRFAALLLALFGSVSVSTAQSDTGAPVPTKSGCTAKALGRHPDPRLRVACFYLPFVDASFMDEDYTMFIWGQDFENVRILDTRFDPTRKIVSILIENFGNTTLFDYHFITENGTLRIDNIVYHLIGRDERLKDFLK